MKILIRVVINAIALVVAAKIVPNITLDTGGGTLSLVYLGIVALIFGLINTYIKPIASLMSLPLNLFAMGLVGFIVNAAMLLLTAFAVGLLQSHPYILRLDRFPPDLSVNALVTKKFYCSGAHFVTAYCSRCLRTRALVLDITSAIAWAGKGAALWGLDRFAEAIDACDEALKIDPDYARAWNNKGAALRRLSEYYNKVYRSV